MAVRNQCQGAKEIEKEIGERIYMNIILIKHESKGGSKYWGLFMDDHSGFLINRSLKKKSDRTKAGSMLIMRLKDQHGIKIKIIKCGNAGENKTMEEAFVELDLGTQFDYTAVGKPK